MVRYPALVDGPVLVDRERGAYGVSFPDLPGCVAMGLSVDEALLNAEDSLRDWAAATTKNAGARCHRQPPWRGSPRLPGPSWHPFR